MPNLKNKSINEGLALALKAQAEASSYQTSLPEVSHIRADGTSTVFKVNNTEIFNFLIQPLSCQNFSELFSLCESKGVFDLAFEHHIPNVTLTAGSRHMTRKWPRDHAGMLPLIADRYPDEFWPGLHKTAASYLSRSEISAFRKVLQNPSAFKKNAGISHVFWLNADGKLHRDHSWKMNQRIESHGEFLHGLADALTTDLEKGILKNFTEDTILNIVFFTHYLHVLGINPQTCGPWEEIPFAKGSNWDCASVIMAFQAVLNLMEKLQFHPNILQLFLKSETELTKKFKRPLLLSEPKHLQNYCTKSQANICRNYLNEFRGLTERVDSSSAMLAAADINLSPNNEIITDIKARFEILNRFRSCLVGQFGARRYNTFSLKIGRNQISSCDSYLNLNSDVLLDENGRLCVERKQEIENAEQQSGDNSEPKSFCNRAKLGTEKYSAQWGLPLSYAALAYAKIVRRLLDKHTLNKQELELLQAAHNGEVEFISRTYANITGLKPNGSAPLKANGEKALIWKKPEAYQAVSTALPGNPPAFLPGVNSHLGWDASICWQASKLFLQNLSDLEKNGSL